MSHRGRSTSPRYHDHRHHHLKTTTTDDSLFDTSGRQIEAFSRTVQATASQLISGNLTTGSDQNNPFASVSRQLRRPLIQRSVFSFTQQSPRELLRSKFSTNDIEQKALSYIPQELIRTAPAGQSAFSLFEGFKASLPDISDDDARARRKRRHGSKGKLLEGAEEKGSPQLVKMKRERDRFEHRLEMMGIRKTMCASEIREIDQKIGNLNTMRKIVLERLALLEQEEHELEVEVSDLSERVAEMQEQLEDEAALAKQSPNLMAQGEAASESIERRVEEDDSEMEADVEFMSESIYEKLPKTRDSPGKAKKKARMPRRTISMPVLHEHMEPGTKIREIPAHNDLITALDFDTPFGTLVTAALDDTVRVWDLTAGRCMGMLEGHLSSVRCLQVEENLVATGSMDASIRLWDLGQADYNPQAAGNVITSKPPDIESAEADVDECSDVALFTPMASAVDISAPAPGDAMADCHLFTLSAHVAEITALDFRGNTLVSGSADKTLRQWDLEKGRCVQTLDVLWAAVQASTINSSTAAASPAAESGGWWKSGTGRLGGGDKAEADFVGAVQVFDAALACGTADGMVRLWDLRSGMVHRSLVGHTGPVTALQFDDVYLVTGSRDRSIRIWDLRTGTIHDAFAYEDPITSMQFDARRIIAAAGEDVVKVYDKADGRQWNCGAGAVVAECEPKPSVVERVRIKDGYLVEGRRDGIVGVWSC